MAALEAIGGEPVAQFVPFVLVLAIFYFIILLPMRRKQQKVEEFLGSLKAGDRVITTGGIYGTDYEDLNDQSVQLQIAENIRIEVREGGHRRLSGAGAGVVERSELAYEQEPALENPHLRRGVRRVLGGRHLPDPRRPLRHPGAQVAHGQAAEARPRPEGRCAPGAARSDRRCAAPRDRAEMERLRESLKTAGITGGTITVDGSRRSSGSKGSRRTQDAAFRQAATDGRDELRPQPRRRAATYTFTMKPNIAGQPARGGGHPGASDDRAARQRAGRHRAEHRAAGRQRRRDPRAAPRRHRRQSGEGDHRFAGPPAS